MECEICGKKVQKVFVTEIEGVTLRVCEECSKSGKILNVIEEEKSKRIAKMQNLKYEEEYELVENYGVLICEARSQAGLSVEELAKRIKEKSNLIRKIEREEIRPSDKLVRELEKILKIKLEEKIEERRERKKEGERKLRIADVVEIKD